ncbi:MAG: class I SAM-dependent methyltransferase [Pseudomonadota bacterium]
MKINDSYCCPACGNTNLSKINYREGVILICKVCRLQFGHVLVEEYNRAVTVRDEGILLSTGNHYMDPSSIGDPQYYTPYTEFIRTISDRFQIIKGARILDIGCGNGIFIKHCLKLGYDAYGVEINEKIKESIPCDIRHRIIWKDASKMDLTDLGKFDVVTFWDSFEHMKNGFDLLESIKANLSEKCIIYLRVNNNNDILNLVSLALLNIFPSLGKKVFKTCFGFPTHLWNYSVTGMKLLADKYGWRVEYVLIGETPASRLASSRLMRIIFELGYRVNRAISGGKIGNYYIRFRDKR